MLCCGRIAFGAVAAKPATAARDEQPLSEKPVFSGISAKLMSRMGYKEGTFWTFPCLLALRCSVGAVNHPAVYDLP